LETHLPCPFLQIVDDKKLLEAFSRTISVSKEAFEKAMASNINTSFAAVLRFMNMTQVWGKKVQLSFLYQMFNSPVCYCYEVV